MIKVIITGLVIHKGKEIPINEEVSLPDHQARYLIQHKRAKRAPKAKKDDAED